MSTLTRTLYDPATHPIAAAYAAASTAECRVARRQWVASDEQRGYRLTVDHAVGLRRGDPVPPRRELPLRCRPTELPRRVDQWASAIAGEQVSQNVTYWLVCHAYPVHPRTGRSDHRLLVKYILAVHPDTPPCIEFLPHNWRAVNPSMRVCSRCGLHHKYREQASSEAPWPWQSYGRSEDYDGFEDDGIGVGDEIGYQGHIWKIVKVVKEDGRDGLLTLVLPGTSRAVTLTLADILKSGREEVGEEEWRWDPEPA